jgi:tetratricopeptide (TPR) repeat protein
MLRIVCLFLLLGNFLALSASETNEATATPAKAAPEEHEGAKKTDDKSPEARAQADLELVRTLRFQKALQLADKQAQDLLGEENPPEIRRQALLEVAYVATDAEELAKAQQTYNEYLRRYPKDPSVPEVCLRQGLLLRKMGAHQQALSKFYQVMNHALSLKLTELEYYQGLVLKAKTEIAETYYLQGKYADAADYFLRLLKAEEKGLDRMICHFKLIRSLSALAEHEKVIAQAQSFIGFYPNSLDLPEVRYMLADSLKKVGRNRDAMQQVLVLLQTQQKQAEKHPEIWAYWQQKTGNEIANELYKEGDYMSALEIYLGLANINTAATWQTPVWYQIGLVYEHLKQPAKAAEMYEQILKRQQDIRTNSPTPGLLALLEMAQWRRGYLKWAETSEAATQKLNIPAPSSTAAKPSDVEAN